MEVVAAAAEAEEAAEAVAVAAVAIRVDKDATLDAIAKSAINVTKLVISHANARRMLTDATDAMVCICFVI